MHYADGVLHIANIAAPDLARRFGTPLYVYDAAVIRRQIERVKRAFARLPFRPFYAMKANSNLSILRLVHRGGFGAYAVSPGEIFLAKHAGFSAEEIWFTCSNVSDEDLRAIDDARIVINLNSMSEVDRILALGLPNPVALRVNPDVGAGHHADVVTAGGGVKFGIDLAEIDEARKIVEDAGHKVVGLHAHIGSGVDTLGPLLESARRLLTISTAFGHLRWLNFGGGISVPYRPADREFPIDEYGAELRHAAERLLPARDLTAILAPGRSGAARARSSSWPATSASPATSSRATPTATSCPARWTARRSTTSSPSATPARTASRWLPTTTRASCRRRRRSTAPTSPSGPSGK